MMRALSLRERRLALAAGIVLPLTLMWQVVLSPALAQRAEAMSGLEALARIEAALDRASPDLSQPARALPPLRQRVTDTARAAGIEIRRLDPAGRALSVSVDQVGFAALVGWLDGMTRAQSVRVLSAEIGRRTEPGTVRARLLLEAVQ